MNVHKISGNSIDNKMLLSIEAQPVFLELSREAIEKIGRCRDFLDIKLNKCTDLFYGINTGFGFLQNVAISNGQIADLQYNLLKSHACGLGEEVPEGIVKWMLFLKVQSLAQGYSGVQIATVQRLIDFYNNNITPVVYTQGSLGASGDLAPLAHLCLPLLGEGEVWYQNEKVHASKLLAQFGWEAITLQSKEGLALLNGTQFMSAYGVHILIKALKFSWLADLIATISLEGFDGRKEPFNELIHYINTISLINFIYKHI